MKHASNRSLQEWSEAINKWAESKGWNDEPRSAGDWAALAHSEISEALEAHRKGEELVWYDRDVERNGIPKPEGEAAEYADCIIRILHWAAVHGVNMGFLVEAKMNYNHQREPRHGDMRRV